MRKRITALALACVMGLGTVAAAAGAEKSITVTPMSLSVDGRQVTPTKSDGTPAEVFAYEGATYAPVRYLAELMGFGVEWDKNDAETAKLVSSQTFEHTVDWAAEYDVIVVGFGASGGTAAITAADAGARVLLLEKAPEGLAGGNSRVCMQWIAYVDPKDHDQAVTYMKNLRGDFATPSDELIETYISGLSDNLSYMLDVLKMETGHNTGNVEFPEMEGAGTIQTLTGNGSRGGDGYMYFRLKDAVESRDNIDVWYSSPAEHLIQDGDTGIIHGVTAKVDGKEVNLRARNGVVLACGGFESNKQMLQDYGVKTSLVSLGGAMFNTGDGIRMAQEVGANLWHMGNMVYADLDFRYEKGSQVFGTQRGLAKKGVIMVGGDGTRFMNEDKKSSHGKTYFHGNYVPTPFPDDIFMVMDQEVVDMGPLHGQFSEGNKEEIESGWLVKADTLEELAGKIGVPAENLVKTVELNNECVERGEDILFGRDITTMKTFSKGPYYAIRMVPSVVNTQGGPERSVKGEVMGLDGKPIPHLYECGELGDVWSYCYQASCNIGGGMAFGRISGANAAAAKSDNFQGSVMEGKTAFAPEKKAETEYPCEANQYIGRGQGMGGTKVVVRVTVNGDKITKVEVLESVETPGVADRALRVMPERIAQAGSTEVDTVSGGTVTSRAILAAVEDALSKK